MPNRLSTSERERGALLVALFSVLVHAWTVNDFERAAQARRELLNAGVTVQFRRVAESEVSLGK